MPDATALPPAATPKCERLLERFTKAPDGRPLDLLKLRGVGVPTDAEFFLCRRTFVALQVRVKTSDQQEGLVHEYALEPEAIGPASKGGVYEIQCQRSKHQLQVKVQPPLGMEELLPPYDENAGVAEMGALLEKELWPLLGAYYVFAAFVLDPAKTSVPLSTGYGDSTKHVDWILGDQRMLDHVCAKCSIFSRSYGQPPAISLVDPARPKTRGMLLKAFLEVKMLVVRAITQIRFTGEAMLSEDQFRTFEEFMMFVYEDCCTGGVDAQHASQEESARSLRALICGGAAAGAPGNAADGAATATGAESSKLEKLQRALGEALRHIDAGGQSLGEAGGLGGPPLDAERSGLKELSAKVKRHLEEVEGQLVAEAAKRPKAE